MRHVNWGEMLRRIRAILTYANVALGDGWSGLLSEAEALEAAGLRE